MENYLEQIIKPLVSFPNDVRVERKTDDRGILLTLYVNPADMGRVIGRAGQTAQAIRRLTRAFGMIQKSWVSVAIFDPRRGERMAALDRGSLSDDEFQF